MTVMVSGKVALRPLFVSALSMIVVVVVRPEPPEQPAMNVAITMSAQAAKRAGAARRERTDLRRRVPSNRNTNAHSEMIGGRAGLLDRLKPVLLSPEPPPRIASIGLLRRELFVASSVTESIELTAAPSIVKDPGMKLHATPVGRFEQDN